MEAEPGETEHQPWEHPHILTTDDKTLLLLDALPLRLPLDIGLQLERRFVLEEREAQEELGVA